MYDHFIAVDWAQSNMAIARMTSKSEKIHVHEVPSDVGDIKIYLKNLKGTKTLTVEESTAAQWLYTELREHVDKLIICNPRRNRLLEDGAKTDKTDARKLVQLLRANMLKEVFHSSDEFIYLRKLISGYEDLVKAGVRLKNQRSAMFRANGLPKEEEILEHPAEQFVLQGIDGSLERYSMEKKRYENEFEKLRKKFAMIRNLETIPGIGTIGAVKIAAVVVDPRRFENKNAFISYSGLIKHERISGGRSYGKSTPQFCRTLKEVFKTAAISITRDSALPSNLRSYYEFLLNDKRYPDHNAANAVARRIAVLTLGVLKSKKRFDGELLKKFNG